ncbi:MAG: hypothetical protein RLZZ488_1431 [Pseudomonadota bacterium]|jgi:hypothetical protein
MKASAGRRQPNPIIFPKKANKIPRKIAEIIDILNYFPTGLASTQISSVLRGISATSARSSEITQARVAATRKQIQRTKIFLEKTNANFRLDYCGKSRVWRARLI